MPSASYSHATAVSLGAPEIWAKLNVPATWQAIGPVEDVTGPSFDDEGHLTGFKWHTRVGPRDIDGTAQVVDSTPNVCMAVALDAGELVGMLTAVIEPNGKTESQLEVTLAVTSKGGLASLFFPMISEALGKGLAGQVDEFAAGLS